MGFHNKLNVHFFQKLIQKIYKIVWSSFNKKIVIFYKIILSCTNKIGKNSKLIFRGFNNEISKTIFEPINSYIEEFRKRILKIIYIKKQFIFYTTSLLTQVKTAGGWPPAHRRLAVGSQGADQQLEDEGFSCIFPQEIAVEFTIFHYVLYLQNFLACGWRARDFRAVLQKNIVEFSIFHYLLHLENFQRPSILIAHAQNGQYITLYIPIRKPTTQITIEYLHNHYTFTTRLLHVNYRIITQ